jgi:hypothetical protein
MCLLLKGVNPDDEPFSALALNVATVPFIGKFRLKKAPSFIRSFFNRLISKNFNTFNPIYDEIN